MFRILSDPSSGNTELRLTEITRGDSQIFLSCAWSVFGSVILDLWCVCMVRPAPRLHCHVYPFYIKPIWLFDACVLLLLLSVPEAVCWYYRLKGE